MRHRKSGRKLSRPASQRRSMLRGMVSALITHGRIQSTDAKVKELRRIAERIITLGKRGDLAARRLAARTVQEEGALRKLFSDLGPRYKDRPGGYTRIHKIGDRLGDKAPLSVIELVDYEPGETAKTEK
ncbi:MAG: 50S ribosomal protein L17 [Bradymonadales bacterium]|nr:50S ribosomal protein L17 [Bradymonadales bacterium]